MSNVPNVDEFTGGESKYLKAADLGDDEWELTISSVSEADFDNGRKLVIHFEGTQKGLVSNVTNNRTLKAAFGGCGTWIGKSVVLFTVDTNTPSGDATKGIRIRKPTQRKVIGQRSENPAYDPNDPIPF